MTTDMVINEEEKAEGAAAQQQEAAVQIQIHPDEIIEIFEFLSSNKNIIFKSQQIDDPELESIEKLKIAQSLYEKNRHLFLMRFGGFFEEKHLNTFADKVVNKTDKNDTEEMDLLIRDFHKKLRTKHLDVKNRRFAAMQELIKKGDYFSELEMMKRAPELYQELIGQYLSEDEKKLRDSYDVKNTTFSGILMHVSEQKEVQETLNLAEERIKKAEEVENQMDETEEEMQICSITANSADDAAAADCAVPYNCRQQWGNFDNEQIPCSTSRIKKTSTLSKIGKRPKHKLNNKILNFITAGERELLRQEFLDVMHEEFLAGKDADFDYTKVDDNSDLDDIKQINQDKEDAYFDELSADEGMEEGGGIQEAEIEETEDELDVYMNHLNNHHSLQE